MEVRVEYYNFDKGTFMFENIPQDKLKALVDSQMSRYKELFENPHMTLKYFIGGTIRRTNWSNRQIGVNYLCINTRINRPSFRKVALETDWI